MYVKDKAGNISEGRKIVVENLEPPTCTIFLNPSNPDGDNNWYTSNVNLSMSMTGAPTVFGLATSSQSENGKNSATHTSDGTSITYYGYVKGPTGTDTCSKTFKLDKSASAISTASKIATKDNLTITLSDATSGLAGYTITTTASTPTSWTAISGASFTKTFSLTTGTHYVHVKDKAGNTTYKAVAITALDPPTCAISLDPGSPNGNDNWYTKDVTINMTTSGVVSEKGLATSSGSTNGLTQVVHSTDSNGVVYYGFVKNAAGANSCASSSFKIDKTPPYVNLTGVSWEKIDGSVVSDGCQNINNASGNRTCNIRIRINSGTRYSWSSNRYPVDSGSGVDTSSSTSNGEYAMWTHNGEQPQYTSWNNWSDRQSWNWRCGTCTWLNYSFYYVDKAGNVGPTMTIHFDVEHY